MKLLLCSDVQLGAVCTENLGIKLSHKWDAERTAKFADLIDRTAQNNAGYLILVGKLFGSNRITESEIDSVFKAVSEDQHIQVLSFLNSNEFKRLQYRNDIPENLHLICTNSINPNAALSNSYLDDNVAARIVNNIIEIQLSENEPVQISQGDNGIFKVTGLNDDIFIPIFEPTGFEDAEEKKAGYLVIEWTDEIIEGSTVITNRKYNYETANIKIMPTDNHREIVNKINKEVVSRNFDTFLRITLHGRSPFGLTFNTDALEEKLRERMFFVELYDNTIMDIDEDAFETDISLRSEFVRLALQDDSLSESERNRLISCGWKALGGKEVVAE